MTIALREILKRVAGVGSGVGAGSVGGVGVGVSSGNGVGVGDGAGSGVNVKIPLFKRNTDAHAKNGNQLLTSSKLLTNNRVY